MMEYGSRQNPFMLTMFGCWRAVINQTSLLNSVMFCNVVSVTSFARLFFLLPPLRCDADDGEDKAGELADETNKEVVGLAVRVAGEPADSQLAVAGVRDGDMVSDDIDDVSISVSPMDENDEDKVPEDGSVSKTSCLTATKSPW